MNNLQKSLGINALFSGLSGLGLVIFDKDLVEIFNIENFSAFRIVGFALIFFTISIVYEIYKQRPLAILWIIVQDLLWVVGSVILVASDPFYISNTGNILITIVAFIVLFMGINQTKALAQIDESKNDGIKHLKFERIVKSDKQVVWNLISDVENYHKVAPNIDNVKIISGEGKGMVRGCSHGKDSWTENCLLWLEEKSYSFEVNTEAPDYPFPFRFLKGTWEVQEIDNTDTKIVMFFDFQYKSKFQNILIHPFLKVKFKKNATKLLDNWQEILEK